MFFPKLPLIITQQPYTLKMEQAHTEIYLDVELQVSRHPVFTFLNKNCNGIHKCSEKYLNCFLCHIFKSLIQIAAPDVVNFKLGVNYYTEVRVKACTCLSVKREKTVMTSDKTGPLPNHSFSRYEVLSSLVCFVQE